MNEKTIELTLHKNCLIVHGDKINEIATYWLKRLGDQIDIKFVNNRVERDKTTNYHMTLLTSAEFKATGLTLDEILTKLNISETDVVDLGVGYASKESNKVWFVVTDFLEGDKLRSFLKLKPKDFHITLGFTYDDIHDSAKGVQTLMLTDRDRLDKKQITKIGPKICELALTGEVTDPKILTRIGFRALKEQDWRTVSMIGESLINLKKFTGTYFKSRYVRNVTESDQQAYITLVHTLKGETWQEVEDFPMQEKLLKLLNFPLLNNVLYEKDFSWYHFYEKNQGFALGTENLPRNFSFVTEKLAGSGMLSRPEYFTIIEQVGITDVISLLEVPIDIQKYKHTKINYHHFPIDDRTPPTQDQMINICKLIDLLIKKDSKILVHCMGGIGRTATVIIGYLMWSKKISKVKALGMLRNRRTQLTPSQDSFLASWFGVVCTQDDPIQENQNKLTVKLPTLIVMIGYPASGKSTISTSLANSSDKVIRVNQDEIREKGKCEELVGKYAKKKDYTVILDRCNLSREERRYWIDIAHNPKSRWAIYLDIDVEECKYRITRRKNHPIIREGGGIRILESLNGKLEPPTKEEGFEKIFTVTSIEESNELLRSWGLVNTVDQKAGLVNTVDQKANQKNDDSDIEQFIVKYPRTRHLVNLGGASRDDLIMSASDSKIFYGTHVIIEEKIDGANMGISINKDYQIQVQNRSHYITPKTHAQFKPLAKWLTDHTGELFTILEPGRHILYGEWVHAKHAIGYDQLPDWFIAYDIYDKKTKKFFSRQKLEEALENTTVPIIPKIFEGIIKDEKQLLTWMNKKSYFYDGPAEGIIVRICDDSWLLHKGKVVRSNFLCGNDHWSKGTLEPNKTLF